MNIFLVLLYIPILYLLHAWNVVVDVLLTCYEYAMSSQAMITHILTSLWCILSKCNDINFMYLIFLSIRALFSLLD
jgi:hypothetical protein